MLRLFPAGIGTIVAVTVLIVAVAAIIVKIIIDKKNGKSNCGCDCSYCANSNGCNKRKK